MGSLEQHFRGMARNNLWSNHRLHRACAALPEAEYFRDRRGFFRSIHGTLNHILYVDQRYLKQLAGETVESGGLDRELWADLGALTREQQATDRRLIALADGLTPEELAAVVRWRYTDGRAAADPVHVVLAHLFVHQIHHRGQVHAMLSQAGAAPPQLDEFFLSQDAALRAEELRDLGLA